MEIHYEELLGNPAAGLKVLFDFLDLKWSEEEIVAAVEQNSFEMARKDGGSKIPLSGALADKYGKVAVEPEGFFRKGKAGSWRDDLAPEDLMVITDVAGSAMRALGYIDQ
jgi:hypothetical protein